MSRRTRLGLRTKISLMFGVLLVCLGLVLNFYPTQIVHSQMLLSAEDDMLGTLSNLRENLNDFSQLSEDNISAAVRVLGISALGRVVVTDLGGIVLYDSRQTGNLVGSIALFPEIVAALEGSDTFRCIYDDGKFEGHAAVPIFSHGESSGVAYFLRNYTENARILTETRENIALISGLLFIAGGLFVSLFCINFSRRMERLLKGIDAIGSGDYDHQIDLHGRDEIAVIATEFNEISLKLKRVEAIRRQFVTDASHELKTPLASIKLLSDSIVQNENMGVLSMREFAVDISNEIARLSLITEELLALSHLGEQPEIIAVPCDIRDNVARCIGILKPYATVLGVEIESDIEEETFVRGTYDGLYHIIFNLLDNAVKYNRPGGKVLVSAYYEQNELILCIEDSGVGIKEEELSKIFDRFYRVDKARSKEIGGTGLGLSIVREWALRLGVKVNVESAYGIGTKFLVVFKLMEDDLI